VPAADTAYVYYYNRKDVNGVEHLCPLTPAIDFGEHQQVRASREADEDDEVIVSPLPVAPAQEVVPEPLPSPPIAAAVGLQSSPEPIKDNTEDLPDFDVSPAKFSLQGHKHAAWLAAAVKEPQHPEVVIGPAHPHHNLYGVYRMVGDAAWNKGVGWHGPGPRPETWQEQGLRLHVGCGCEWDMARVNPIPPANAAKPPQADAGKPPSPPPSSSGSSTPTSTDSSLTSVSDWSQDSSVVE